MEVRPATVDDVPAIQTVARATWHAAYDDVVGADAVDAQVDEWYDDDSVTEGVTRSGWPYLVAEVDGGVVGYAAGGPTDDGPAEAVLAAIYVRPERWGEGVGTELLAALHGRLRDLDCGSVWLAVLADNDRAVRFYGDHGYRTVERRETTVGGTGTEELVMRRAL